MRENCYSSQDDFSRNFTPKNKIWMEVGSLTRQISNSSDKAIPLSPYSRDIELSQNSKHSLESGKSVVSISNKKICSQWQIHLPRCSKFLLVTGGIAGHSSCENTDINKLKAAFICALKQSFGCSYAPTVYAKMVKTDEAKHGAEEKQDFKYLLYESFVIFEIRVEVGLKNSKEANSRYHLPNQNPVQQTIACAESRSFWSEDRCMALFRSLCGSLVKQNMQPLQLEYVESFQNIFKFFRKYECVIPLMVQGIECCKYLKSSNLIESNISNVSLKRDKNVATTFYGNLLEFICQILNSTFEYETKTNGNSSNSSESSCADTDGAGSQYFPSKKKEKMDIRCKAQICKLDEAFFLQIKVSGTDLTEHFTMQIIERILAFGTKQLHLEDLSANLACLKAGGCTSVCTHQRAILASIKLPLMSLYSKKNRLFTDLCPFEHSEAKVLLKQAQDAVRTSVLTSENMFEAISAFTDASVRNLKRQEKKPAVLKLSKNKNIISRIDSVNKRPKIFNLESDSERNDAFLNNNKKKESPQSMPNHEEHVDPVYLTLLSTQKLMPSFTVDECRHTYTKQRIEINLTHGDKPGKLADKKKAEHKSDSADPASEPMHKKGGVENSNNNEHNDYGGSTSKLKKVLLMLFSCTKWFQNVLFYSIAGSRLGTVKFLGFLKILLFPLRILWHGLWFIPSKICSFALYLQDLVTCCCYTAPQTEKSAATATNATA